IDFAVGPVIDYAAASAGQHYTKNEDHDVAQRWRALAGNPQCPEGWPQQQVNADRLVHAGQLNEVPGARVQVIERLEQAQVHQQFSGWALAASQRVGRNISETSPLNAPR